MVGQLLLEKKEEWIQEFGSRKEKKRIHGRDESTMGFIGCSKNL
jgi:hypothetical protein